MKIVALIPARGGSKGIPNKNIKLLAGKPLITHTINSAINSKKVTEVYVSTDNKKIAEISKKEGAKIIMRPKKFSTDTATSESALLHFAKKIDFDILVFLQCTSPFTKSEDIDTAINFFLKNKYDSLLSACEDHGGALCGGFTWQDGKPKNYNIKNRPRRQDLKKTYRENGAIYITTKKNLLNSKNRLSGKIGIYEMPAERSFEIDTPKDFELAQKLFNNSLTISQNKLKKIKAILFDVDGIFTDGSIYLNEKGEEILKFSRIDGKGIELLQKNNYILGIISSEDSTIVRQRMSKLNIKEIHTGIKDKLKVYEKIKNKYSLLDEEICFCGDDVQDIPLLEKTGVSICPDNAQEQVKRICGYTSDKRGGSEFVRSIANIFIKTKNKK